jgi:signal transduction histidine kinase
MSQMPAPGPCLRPDPGAAPPGGMQDSDAFIYLMSHDVRGCVRALLELPQWILEDLHDAGVDTTGPVAQSIEMMNRHTARLDRMMTDLLAYSRIGRTHPVAEVDLAATLGQVLTELGLPDTMRITRDITCRHVMMAEQDALLLWRALIGNAAKHHHDAAGGHIRVTVRADGDLVRLRVTDDGPGIPGRLHARALGPMTTLRPRDEVEGSGMGLAHAGRIAAHYGGHICLSDAADGCTGLAVDVVIRRDGRPSDGPQ